MKLVRIGADCEAHGHPTECTEPAPGTVDKTSTHSVTITDSGGVTKQLATKASADMNFPSHAHDHSTAEGCHQSSSHTLDPSTLSSSLTVNGSPIYIAGNGVASDPVTGGDVDIVNAGGNTSVTEKPDGA